MTTIAYKDGIIAYDGRITSGDDVLSDNYDKKHEIDGIAYFITGDIGSEDRWAEAYTTQTCEDIKSGQALIVDDGALYIFTALGKSKFQCYAWDLNEHFAIGTGEKYAIGAMDNGATAAQAVRIGMRDKNTGGKIRTFKL